MRIFIATVLILVVSNPVAFARKWRDSTGKYMLDAEFVDFKDGIVQLMQVHGNTITLPIENFNEADQEFIKNEAAKNNLRNENEKKRKADSLLRRESPNPTNPARASNDKESNKKDAKSPKSKQIIEFRGKFLMFISDSRGEFILIFSSNKKLPSGESYFGCKYSELASKSNNKSFNNLKGIRGKPDGTQSIQFPGQSPGLSGKEYPVLMITDIIPIF
jgi:hypothetical protein